MMQVDVRQWRATIGMFHLSSSITMQRHQFSLLLMLLIILKFYLFCYFFILPSIFLLPLSSFIHILAECMLLPSSNLLHVFARLYEYLRILLYTLLELIQRMHLIIPGVLRYFTVKRLPHAYVYLYASLTLYYELHLQWLTYKTILLSGDIESSPGPNLNTFKFCTWNLNSITAHEFIRIS